MASANVSWGIDIGAGGIKAIKLVREGDGAKVADFQIVPHRRVLTTPDIDPSDVVRLSLGTFMQHVGDDLRGASVVMSVAGHEGFARFAKLPPVDPKGVHNLVKFEAVQQIPFEIDDVEWDYQIFASDDSPELEVGIFAITKDRVAERLAMWGGAGLSPDALTISPIAAFNGISYDLGFTPDTPGTIILDIGATATDLIIAEGGRVWVRTFPFGGHNFTEAIAEAFKLNYSKAEKLKAEAEQTKYKRHVLQALKPLLGDLVSEVQRSIQYYQETHSTAQLERLIGIGSTFKLFGLRKLLSQQLGMDVYRFERFKSQSVDGSGAAAFEAASINLVTAYGLALQGLDLSPISANLIPVSVVRESVWARKTGWFVTAAGLGIAAAAAMFIGPLLALGEQSELGNFQQADNVQRTATNLSSRYSEAAQETALTFNPAIAIDMISGRRLYADIHQKIDELVTESSAQAPAAAEGGAASSAVYHFDSYVLDYIAPGQTAAAGRQPSGAGGRDPFGGGRDGGRDAGRDFPVPPGSGGGGRDRGGRDDADANQGGQVVAGEHGAVRVNLVLLSQTNDRAMFQSAVLGWLQANAESAEAPFTIAGVPNIDDIAITEIRAAGESGPVRRRATDPESARPGGGTGGTPSGGGGGGGFGGAAPGGGFGGAAPGGGFGGAGGGGSDRDGGRDPRGGPDTPGGGGAPAEGGDLGTIAPLNVGAEPFDDSRPVFRYPVTFVLQLKANLEDPASLEAPADEVADAEN
jgi:type IV pilus assembly protein PilM